MEILWTLILPIIILQLILQIIALYDLYKLENIEKNKKILWVIGILIFSMLGPIIYFIFGRREN